ncbi:MAG: MBG domain-containing protein [Gammaproteobacteria bacterium]|nr:MBG domain-containing protein [Gammaproteobacteria bacterium]
MLGHDASVLDDFAVATAATESSDVGSYAIAADGSSSNDDLTFVDGSLSVNPAALTITAHDHSRLYGASNPALTYTADGFVLGHDASVLDDFAVATAATESSDVGSYAIAADGSSSNYELTLVDG